MKPQEMEPKAEFSQMDVVSETEWLVARKDLLTREKEFTRLRDELSRHRRKLPWVKVEQEYLFDGPEGKMTLADLFEGRRQLIVYHFMFGPGWEEGCKSCSYLADHFDGANWHLPHRDVMFVVVSRAPLSELEPYKKRMSWRFKWLSSHDNNFNFDYHVSFTKEDEAKGKVYYNYGMGEFMSDELPGLSVFYKDDDDDIFHTYSAYARGLDILVGTYNLLDLVPKGRDENPDSTMDWVRRHDEYAAENFTSIKGSKTSQEESDNMNAKRAGNYSFEVKRLIKAPRDRVYAAWTDPAQIKRWFGPENVQTLDLIADIRVGGKYRWDITNSEGEKMTARGEYRELQPGKKIVFTWHWDDDETWENHISVVTVELSDGDGGTKLRLTHEQLPNEGSRESHNQGWNSALDKLEKLFSW